MLSCLPWIKPKKSPLMRAAMKMVSLNNERNKRKFVRDGWPRTCSIVGCVPMLIDRLFSSTEISLVSSVVFVLTTFFIITEVILCMPTIFHNDKKASLTFLIALSIHYHKGEGDTSFDDAFRRWSMGQSPRPAQYKQVNQQYSSELFSFSYVLATNWAWG